jgi:tetratricopeptide (TPR) repeat protein
VDSFDLSAVESHHSERDSDGPHLQNFLDCIRTGKRPNADIEIGHLSTRLCHLGNIAFRTGKTLTFDAKTETTGDAEADGLLQAGIEQMTRGDGPAAVETFTKVIQRKPDFAEAWNKRATVYFLMGEHEQSLKDCDEVMKRNPVHFGALAGYGQIYLQLDQPERALTYFRRALRVNPNMRGVQQIIPQLEQLLTERRKRTI